MSDQQFTPEASEPSMPTPAPEPSAYAGFWQRAGAFVIDTLALNAAVILILAVLFFFLSLKQINEMESILSIALFLVTFLYKPLMEASRYQGTLGKMATGIAVTNAEGEKISFLRALGRMLATILSAIPLFLGFVMAGFTKKKQALHDLIAKTQVIKTRERSYFWRIMVIVTVLNIALFAAAWGYVAQNLGGWITSGMEQGMVAAKQVEQNMDASIQKAKVVEEEVDEEKPAYPYPVKEAQYETLLNTREAKPDNPFNKPNPTFDGPTTSPVKAITLELDTFFANTGKGSTQWVKVYAAPETNLGRGGYAIINIDHVLNQRGHDFYNHERAKSFSSFSRIFDGDDGTSAIYQASLKPGIKESSVTEIKGSLSVFLPVNAKLKTLKASDISKSFTDILPDTTVTLMQIGNGEVMLEAKGDNHKSFFCSQVFAYNAQGKLLEKNGYGFSSSGDSTSLNCNIKGTATYVVVVSVENFWEKTYPFTLKK